MRNMTVSVDKLIDEIDRHARLVTDGMPLDATTKTILEAHDQIKHLVRRMDPIGTAYATWTPSEDGHYWFCSECFRMEHEQGRYCRGCGARMEDNT